MIILSIHFILFFLLCFYNDFTSLSRKLFLVCTESPFYWKFDINPFQELITILQKNVFSEKLHGKLSIMSQKTVYSIWTFFICKKIEKIKKIREKYFQPDKYYGIFFYYRTFRISQGNSRNVEIMAVLMNVILPYKNILVIWNYQRKLLAFLPLWALEVIS